MRRSRALARTTIALVVVALWLAGNFSEPLLAKKGLKLGVGDIGDPGGIRNLDNRVRRGVKNTRLDFWDEAEDEHQKKVVLGIIGSVITARRIGTMLRV